VSANCADLPTSAQLELTEARASVELATSKEAVRKNTVEEIEDTQNMVCALHHALAKAHGGFVPYGDSIGSHTHTGRRIARMLTNWTRISPRVGLELASLQQESPEPKELAAPTKVDTAPGMQKT